MNIRIFFATTLVWLFCVSTALHSQQRILVLGWNVESDDNSPMLIARQLESLEGYDIIGLSEVKEKNAALYAAALSYGEGAYGKQSDFQYALGATGGADRLMIVWDDTRFEKIGDAVEIDSLNRGRHRAPFYAHFRLRKSAVEFLFMVNHLARADAEFRQRQAKGLAAWSRQQSLPILAVGDYNFDYNIDDGPGNDAFDIFLNSAFEWIRPEPLVKTSLHPLYSGVLDFFFVANMPANWRTSSEILFRDITKPDDSEFSDHRPVHGLVFIE